MMILYFIFYFTFYMFFFHKKLLNLEINIYFRKKELLRKDNSIRKFTFYFMKDNIDIFI